MSIDELAKTTPVNPPTVKRKMKPMAHRAVGDIIIGDPWIVAIHLNTFTPVGTAIIIVAAVK